MFLHGIIVKIEEQFEVELRVFIYIIIYEFISCHTCV